MRLQPAVITVPAEGALYNAGTTINYAGTGTDAEDGTLTPSAFTWEVVFHHDTHTHPFLAATSGASSGSFVIANVGEVATNVFYRIHLTVRDSTGFTHSVFRDVRPRISTITLQSNPVGLRLTLDGTPLTTPASIPNVVGMLRTLVGDAGYRKRLDSWSRIRRRNGCQRAIISLASALRS